MATLQSYRRDLARLEALNAGRCAALECLPVCPTHGEQMILQTPGTYERAYCGTWYRCPQCANSVLIPSRELLRDLIAQMERDA